MKWDDMEQWVSDTFYSYFPGFNMDYKESHRMKDSNTQMENSKMPTASKAHLGFSSYYNERENESTPSFRSTSSNDSVMEYYPKPTVANYNINDVNYVPKKYSNRAKPGTARYKLLQDLYHSKLAEIINGTKDTDTENISHQIQAARKKEYHSDLMSQIEEKRRHVKHSRDNERKRDEHFTRNMLKNLQAIQLRDYLDIGDMPNKIIPRIKSEVPLLSEKNDIKIPDDFDKADSSNVFGMQLEMNKENIQKSTVLNNKVYKYFSNYHGNGRGNNVQPSVCTNDSWQDNVVPLPDTSKAELECFHLYEKICPNCDAPLKPFNTNNHNYCLRCQNQLTIFTNRQRNKPSPTNNNRNEAQENENDGQINEGPNERNSEGQNMEALSSLPMFICENCNRFYSFCADCLSKSDVCRACQRQKNVCMNCRRKLCVFCLEEVARGKDTEQQHVNEADRPQNQPAADTLLNIQGKGDGVANEGSLRKSKDIVLSSAPQDDSGNKAHNSDDEQALEKNLNSENKLHDHPANDLNSNNINRLRQQTDMKLMSYLKNYGDLAQKSNNRRTRRIFDTNYPKNKNLYEELTIPILHDMPKLKRNETKQCFLSDDASDELKNLNNRWEIPAVHKYLITPTVLTEVGAIRKQLQVERFLSNCK